MGIVIKEDDGYLNPDFNLENLWIVFEVQFYVIILQMSIDLN